MSLRAAFGEVDITPPAGVHKIGWLKVIVGEAALDHAFERQFPHDLLVGGVFRLLFDELPDLLFYRHRLGPRWLWMRNWPLHTTVVVRNQAPPAQCHGRPESCANDSGAGQYAVQSGGRPVSWAVRF